MAVTGTLLGDSTRTEWSCGRVGALSAGELCFLLAAQAVVRGLAGDELGVTDDLLAEQRKKPDEDAGDERDER